MFSFLLFPHRGCQNVCQRTCWKSQYCHLHADADLTTAFRKGKCVNMDCCCCFLVAQLCLTLLWPCGLQPTRLNHPWNFPGKNTGMGCHFLLQGIFPTQGLNPGLLHFRHILNHLSHQGSPLCVSYVLDSVLSAFTFINRLPWWLSGKESICQCKRHEFSVPASGRSPAGRNGNPL